MRIQQGSQIYTNQFKKYPPPPFHPPPPIRKGTTNQQVITDKILFYNSMTFACSEKKSETIQALYIGKSSIQDYSLNLVVEKWLDDQRDQ